MVYKIFYLGQDIDAKARLEHDLILLIIKKLTGKRVEIVTNISNADLTIVYPYYVSKRAFKIRWIVIWLLSKFTAIEDGSQSLKWLFGIGNHKVLFISHENLDRAYWWNNLGKFLISSKIPRLTFWPKEIDPHGARFPYWYNYVEWPEYPRPNFYSRFGRLYTIKELCSPLSTGKKVRKDGAIAICSHLDHPRKSILKSVTDTIKIDIYGQSGTKVKGSKLEIMQEYKYAFCPENSTGFGYDTEKIPEAWVAGCLPIGIFLNPYSQFNKKLSAQPSQHSLDPSTFPLLEEQPSLTEIESYVRSII